MRVVAWFFGLLLIVVVSIFGVILIRNTLRGFRTVSPTNVETVRVSDQDLNVTKVEYIIDGPVVADEDFRSIRYEISASGRTGTVRQGYKLAMLREQKLGNNITAFTDLAAALDNAGFGRERENRTSEASQGRCSNGKFYIMRIITNGEVKQELWSDACFGSRSGTFGGNRSSVDTLFRLQFPDHSDLVNNIGGRF